ncbi:class I SAM-dependent methyltransferase [Isoptericola sp. NPDC057391]|uniref:class I SAM-dependent methyltransferase n=1 Tax=Isoptericola sp. NPDC057391 TaxID=3346117 RepID=UPI00363DC3E6
MTTPHTPAPGTGTAPLPEPLVDWRDRYAALAEVELPVGPYTQVSEWERAFLYLVARDLWSGRGDVVELGSGGGGSTVALAQGLAENSVFDRAHHRLHAYDWFRVGRGTFASPRFADDGPGADGSFLADFRAHLAGYLDLLDVHAGDLAETSTDPPHATIELLHVDIAKTPRVFRLVAERFFPLLAPGAVVLHQDFASPRLPWLHHSTGALLPWVDLVGPPVRSTLAFVVREPVPAAVLDRIARQEADVDEQLDLISRVQDRLGDDVTGGIPFPEVLELAKAYAAFHAGEHRRAWEIAAPLRRVPYLAERRADHFEQLRRAALDVG